MTQKEKVQKICDNHWEQTMFEDMPQGLSSYNEFLKQGIIRKAIELQINRFLNDNSKAYFEKPQDSYDFLKIYVHPSIQPGLPKGVDDGTTLISFSRYGNFYLSHKYMGVGKTQILEDTTELPGKLDASLAELGFDRLDLEVANSPYTFDEEYYQGKKIRERLFGYY